MSRSSCFPNRFRSRCSLQVFIKQTNAEQRIRYVCFSKANWTSQTHRHRIRTYSNAVCVHTLIYPFHTDCLCSRHLAGLTVTQGASILHLSRTTNSPIAIYPLVDYYQTGWIKATNFYLISSNPYFILYKPAHTYTVYTNTYAYAHTHINCSHIFQNTQSHVLIKCIYKKKRYGTFRQDLYVYTFKFVLHSAISYCANLPFAGLKTSRFVDVTFINVSSRAFKAIWHVKSTQNGHINRIRTRLCRIGSNVCRDLTIGCTMEVTAFYNCVI